MQVDSVYIDFSKAFDLVNHKLLIDKARCIGIDGSVIKWLESYLTSRTQFVKIRSSLSREIVVSSGVPQGSHLGPILFAIYMNDVLPCLINSKLVVYADDLKIFNVIKSPMDCGKIQDDLSNVLNWSVENGLTINSNKCNIISFNVNRQSFDFNYIIGNQNIERVNCVKDLGILLDSTLSFDKHIEYIVSKVSRIVGFITRFSKDFYNTDTILKLYKTLVLPNFTYCCQIWRPYKNYLINYLESAQHRIMRLLARKANIYFHRFDHDYSRIMRIFKINTIESIMNYHDSLISYRLINNLVSIHDLSELFVLREQNYNLRNPRGYLEDIAKRNLIFHSTRLRLPRLWNSIPRVVRELDFSAFKNKFNEFFMSN